MKNYKELENIKKDLEGVDFVCLAKELLYASIKASRVLQAKPYTPENMKESKLVLTYLNALTRAYQVKLSHIKFIRVDDKSIKGLKEHYNKK